MIDLRTGTKIWLAAGVTDMRRGFDGLSAKVQTVLEQQTVLRTRLCFSRPQRRHRQAFVVGRDGLCLFAKRLERGRFIWPQATEELFV